MMKKVLLMWLSMATFVSVLGDTEKEKSKPEPFVYSYSKVTSDGGSLQTKMLTIATGDDGKYHYVKQEGDHLEKGVWIGNLPEMAHITKADKTVSEEMSKLGQQLSAMDALVKSFDSSIGNYIKSLRVF